MSTRLAVDTVQSGTGVLRMKSIGMRPGHMAKTLRNMLIALAVAAPTHGLAQDSDGRYELVIPTGKAEVLETPASYTDLMVANPDIADDYNTVRKMACKRAHVAAILFVTCASEIFTQDVEDMGHDAGYDSPAQHPDEERNAPPVKSAKFDRCVAIMADVEKAVGNTNPVKWEHIVVWRGQLGARSGWPATELNGLLNQLYAGDEIAVVQKKELGQTWNRIDRQVKRYEGVVPRPSADDSDESEDL